MDGKDIQRWSISALALISILYSLVVLWYIPTQPCIPLGCLLPEARAQSLPGIEIRDTSRLKLKTKDALKIWGEVPEVGDVIVAACGRPIRSFTEWTRLHRDLRNWKVESGAVLAAGKNPARESVSSNLGVFEFPDKNRVAAVWIIKPGQDQPVLTCLPLVAPSLSGVSLTLLWFVLELCVLVVGGVAYWNRPFDKPLRTFFALSAVTLAAFVGGSHWTIIAGSLPLTLGFVIAGTLLPAVLLHFFLAYPFPIAWRSRAVRGVYIIPAIAAFVLSIQILAVNLVTLRPGHGPFNQMLSRYASDFTVWLEPILRYTIFIVFGFAVLYFLLSMVAIQRCLKVARNPMELNQVRTLMGAACVAAILISYTMYLIFVDQVNFALGAGRLPMFGASLAFMLAYAVGIARYKLLLIDQVVSRGAWYYFASVGLALIFSALIAVGAMQALHQDLSIFGQTVPLILVLMTAVFVMSWGRDALQRVLDRQFFSEKYQLDKALNRMNRVISSVLEPDAVADSLLTSCKDVLHVSHVTLYLRKGNRSEFRMARSCGQGQLPPQINIEASVLESLDADQVLQRVSSGGTPAQRLLRQLQADVVYGLEMQGELGGLLVLGAKPNNQHFSAEDLAFVGAMARISGVALHCATVQQDVARLNQDLQLKISKIDDQHRQLTVLQNELASLSKPSAPAAAESEFRRQQIRGNSPAILAVLETVKKVAPTDASVLIRGESGTGKELLARTIHDNSTRRDGPLVSVHCASLSPSLLESELFGHVRGAFTDARQDKQGRFQMADGGTLFLDEIGDISLDVQVKLLRVLQERVFEPVGSTQTIAVNVRIVAATHRNLEHLIKTGQFREDLFYRLNVISITLPALRERQEDLYELALHFLQRSSAKTGKSVLHIDDEAMKCLHNYHWQGNIRELENAIERAVVLAEGNSIRLQDLPLAVQDAVPWADHQQMGIPSLSAVGAGVGTEGGNGSRRRKAHEERQALADALQHCQGNKAEAARLLGIPRSTFFSKLKKHGLG